MRQYPIWGIGVAIALLLTGVPAAFASIEVPPDMTVNASSPSGAVVKYSVKSVYSLDNPVAVQCNPQSGSVFPVGQTTVVCAATDTEGNSNSNSFMVNVRSQVTTVSALGTIPNISGDAPVAEANISASDIAISLSILSAALGAAVAVIIKNRHKETEKARFDRPQP